MSQPLYKFKWTNVDLNSYIENRRFVAKQKRREAEVLIKQAEAIEEEMQELNSVLEPVKEKEIKYEASISTNPPTLARV
jgi:hypothetical protein